MAEHHLLGKGDILVSRPGNDIDLRNGFGAVGERRDGLRPAQFEHTPDTQTVRQRDQKGMDGTVRSGRRGQEDVGNARDLGRNDVHENGGRIERPSAGNIDAGALHGRDQLAVSVAVLLIGPRVFLLFLVEFPDVFGRVQEGPEHVAEFGFRGPPGLIDFFTRNFQLEITVFHAVKTAGVILEGLVPGFPDASQNLLSRPENIRPDFPHGTPVLPDIGIFQDFQAYLLAEMPF